jgi:hypothetical protein
MRPASPPRSEPVGHLALQVRSDGAVLGRDADVGLQVEAGQRLRLRDPTHRAACGTVPLQHAEDLRVDAEDHRVHTAFLAESERLARLLVGEVMLEERRNVNEVSGVSGAADEVAAANEAPES